MNKDVSASANPSVSPELLDPKPFDPIGDAMAALERARGTGEKFRLTGLGKENYFLPSYEQCCHYLIPGFSLRKGIEFLEESLEQPLPIGRSSRSALFNAAGAGYPTAKKFMDWMAPHCEEFFSYWDIISISAFQNAQAVGSNADGWISSIVGIRYSQAFRDGHLQEQLPQLEFLEERCRADTQMVGSLRQQILAGELSVDDVDAVFRAMRPFWLKDSLVPRAHWQAFEAGLSIYASKGALSQDQKRSLLAGFFSVYFDFYFHLFACYEVGCVLAYAEDRSELTTKRGILCRAMTNFAQKLGKMTCLGELLGEIQDVYSQRHKEVSARGLASFIPLGSSASSPSNERESDRYYAVLKAWKKGKETPSIERLEGFFDNLSEEAEAEAGTNEPLVMLCQMAIAIDKAATHWKEQIAKEVEDGAPLLAALFESIGRYEVYYQHHLDKQLEKAAGG